MLREMWSSRPIFFQCSQSPSSREPLSCSACYHISNIKNRIAAQFFSEFPSQVRQTMGFLEPTVKERFEKMDELGNTWENAPVRSPVSIEVHFCCSWNRKTGWYVDVAHERSQRSWEITRWSSPKITLSQLCVYSNNFCCKAQHCLTCKIKP